MTNRRTNANPQAHSIARGAGPALSLPIQRVIDLQRSAGNCAVSGLLQVSRDGSAVPPPAKPPRPVNKLGVIDQDGRFAQGGLPGLNLRAAPSTNEPPAPLGRFAHGKDHVYVKSALEGGWLEVVGTDGPLKGAAGYVYGHDPKHNHVNTDLPPDPEAPDPRAELHTVKAGEQAHVFVRNHPAYGKATQEVGQDERFFTNVMRVVNQKATRGGIYEQEVVRNTGWMGAPQTVTETWLRAGSTIWVPSLDYALSLKGVVSAGSWQRDALEKVKDFGKALAGGAAFLAGLAVGAVESIKDLFVGVVELLYDTLKSGGANLVEMAKSIYGLITDPKKRTALLEAVAGKLDSLWNAEGFFRRWYNRGWVIGYATMEVIAGFLLPGVGVALKGSKLAGAGAKLLKVVGSSRIADTVSTVAKAGKAKLAVAGAKVAHVADSARVLGIAGRAAATALANRLGASVTDVMTWIKKRLPSAPKPTRHFVSGAQKAKALAAAFGYPVRKLTGFMRFAKQHKVRLWLRKANRSAPARLAEGAIPKPMDIKAKSINEFDRYLNSALKETDLGLVGYFDPVLPKRPPGMSGSDWGRLKARRRERAREFRKLAGDMKRLATPKAKGDVAYKVENGVIKQVDTETGTTAALAGDVDLFQITKADGSPLSPKEYDKLMDLMVEQGLIEHGAHAWWKLRQDFDPAEYKKIVKQHDKEPLVEIGTTMDITETVGSAVPGL